VEELFHVLCVEDTASKWEGGTLNSIVKESILLQISYKLLWAAVNFMIWFHLSSKGNVHSYVVLCSLTLLENPPPPPNGATGPSGSPHYRVFMITPRDTPHSAVLLWKSDQPYAETSNPRHTISKDTYAPAGFEPAIPESKDPHLILDDTKFITNNKNYTCQFSRITGYRVRELRVNCKHSSSRKTFSKVGENM
jgi:hypothetical protein